MTLINWIATFPLICSSKEITELQMFYLLHFQILTSKATSTAQPWSTLSGQRGVNAIIRYTLSGVISGLSLSTPGWGALPR